MARKEILIEQADKLRKMKIPKGWEVAKIDVHFKQVNQNAPIDAMHVVYDSMNNQFYAKNHKVIVYESQAQDVIEAIEIVKSANRIIKNAKKENE